VLLLRGSDYEPMDGINLVQQVEENGEEDVVEGSSYSNNVDNKDCLAKILKGESW
jgi:hypothetical protein